MKIPNNGINYVLGRIKRGLVGYISYLAACEMNESFSEYLLYEPVLRILTVCKYKVKCEYPCHGLKTKKDGDLPRIDFYAETNGKKYAMEVEWVGKNKQVNTKKDKEKLKFLLKKNKVTRSFLCILGRKSSIEKINLSKEGFSLSGKPADANLGRTRYVCKVFELTKS